MEVHHHAHEAHGKKTWKAYFWEFLMLFLAVFCGFLAENIRETRVEHHREKEYMVSLYHDLKADTSNMSLVLKTIAEEIANNDSLFVIFNSKRYLRETADAYYYGRRTLNSNTFYPTDGTVTQLESAGGLRLIRNRAVVDSIQSYQQALSRLKSIQDIEKEHSVMARSYMGKIFDANVFDLMIGNSTIAYKKPDKDYPLMPFTTAELNDFHIPLNFMKRNKLTQIRLITGLQKKATDMMKLLEEDYHVSQE
jgi:hypothetical protein